MHKIPNEKWMILMAPAFVFMAAMLLRSVEWSCFHGGTIEKVLIRRQANIVLILHNVTSRWPEF
jgi:hypothetical protein